LKVLEENFSEFPTALSFARIEEFSSKDYAALYQGKAIFPRWMKTGVGDTGGSGTAFSALPFDHLSFSLTSRTKYPFDVVLPINDPISYLPNSSEVIVVGCQNDPYFDALAVFVLYPEKVVYYRPGIDKLECPLQKP
jgi:hypothetical protein